MNDASYNLGNDRREYNTDKFYNKMIVHVEKVLGRKLERSEIRETVSFVQNIDSELLAPKYVKKTIPLAIKTLVSEFSKFKCSKPEEEDSQQILREMIGVSSESSIAHGIYDDPNRFVKTTNIAAKEKQNLADESAGAKVAVSRPSKSDVMDFLGMTNSDEAARVLNPQSMLRKNYMVLDSRARILASDAGGIAKFAWNYVQNSQLEAQGTTNVIGNVRDIVALRVYPFRIPYVKNADNDYSRISVFIEELGSQAFIAHEDRKFHFMLRSTVDSEFIELETNKLNDGFFYFEKPVTTLNTLTVSFGSPLEKIIFPVDRSWCSIDYFSIAPLTQITTLTNSTLGAPPMLHGLTSGDKVYFSLFNVEVLPVVLSEQNFINQGIKEEINREGGFEVTVINPTSFSIDYNSSGITAPIPDIRFRVFFGSKRIFMPVEITYIKPENDNE